MKVLPKHVPFLNYETQSKPIIIVPIHKPEEEMAMVAAAPAQLVYNNGPLLTAVQVYTIFWGSALQQSPASDMVNNLNSFFDYILTSSLMDQMADYSTSGQTIGHGSRIGTTTITTSDPGSLQFQTATFSNY